LLVRFSYLHNCLLRKSLNVYVASLQEQVQALNHRVEELTKESDHFVEENQSLNEKIGQVFEELVYVKQLFSIVQLTFMLLENVIIYY